MIPISLQFYIFPNFVWLLYLPIGVDGDWGCVFVEGLWAMMQLASNLESRVLFVLKTRKKCLLSEVSCKICLHSKFIYNKLQLCVCIVGWWSGGTGYLTLNCKPVKVLDIGDKLCSFLCIIPYIFSCLICKCGSSKSFEN